MQTSAGPVGLENEAEIDFYQLTVNGMIWMPSADKAERILKGSRKLKKASEINALYQSNRRQGSSKNIEFKD